VETKSREERELEGETIAGTRREESFDFRTRILLQQSVWSGMANGVESASSKITPKFPLSKSKEIRQPGFQLSQCVHLCRTLQIALQIFRVGEQLREPSGERNVFKR
jgi:hypothetical protein